MLSSSSPRGTPNRRQSSAIEHIPFSTNLSHLSAELSRTDSAASSPCRSEVSFGGHSFRDQEHQKKSLEEENFKLKLRVYMLEERLQRQDSNEGSNKALAELKVQSAALREELAQKNALLRRASETLEVLEQRQSEQQARLRQDQAERALLEDTLEELEAQYRAELEQHEATEADRQRLEGALLALRAEQRETATRAGRAEQEVERAAAAITNLRQSHADECRRRERTEQERSRLQEELSSLQRRHDEETRRREQLTEENSRLQALVSRLPLQEVSRLPPQEVSRLPPQEVSRLPPQEASRPANHQELRSSPADSDGRCRVPAGPALLQRQLAAVAGERRREQAVAAAALQLQTERSRSLQASVQSLSEQVRRGQAELAECRAERDRLLLLQPPQRESSDSEAMLSSTEGVEVIPEPTATESREDLLHSCESPGLDLAAWLGSMPRLRSDSLEEPAVGPPPAASPAPSHTQGPAWRAVRRAIPAADNSDWETWSEPDRSVSQARIGLERRSLEPPQGEITTDTDTRPGRRSQRQTSAEVQDLEGRIEGLRHVRDGLWAEVAICQKLVTAAAGSTEQQGVTLPAELLEDVQQLHRRLEDAVAASDRVCRRPDSENQWSTPPPELTLALTITQEELAESAQKLSAAQQRTQRLRARLQQTRDRLQQTEQDKQRLEQQRDDTAQQLSRLTERLEQTEAEQDRLAETARRQADQQESDTLRQLRHQLERSSQRQQELEQLVRRLSCQLRQLPAAGGEATAAEQRVWRAEQQLLTLGRQRLRLQADITRLRSRARLLQSQESVRDSRQAEAEAESATAGRTGRQQPQQLPRQQSSGSSSSAAGGGSSRAVRELTQQLKKAQAQIERMRVKAQEYDEAGHSCAESNRSCELSLVASSPADGQRLSSHSESDPHEPLRTSCGQPAYSSPDLGIESDCQRCSSPASSATVQSQRSDAADRTPRPSGGEEPQSPAAGTTDLSTLAATRTALQEALRRLDRAEHSKAAVQSAVYRGLGQTQLLVSRARGGLRRPAVGTVEE